MAAPPWRTTWTQASRSRAMVIARHTCTLSKGARLWLITTLSLPLFGVSLITIDGAAFLTCSAITLVISVGNETSRRPASSAARRVPRSLMIG
jgi:hypothetical protein